MAKEMSIVEALKTYKVGGEFHNRYGWSRNLDPHIFDDAEIGDKYINREGYVCEYMGKDDIVQVWKGERYTSVRHLIKQPHNKHFTFHFDNGRYDSGFIPYDIIAKYPENET